MTDYASIAREHLRAHRATLRAQKAVAKAEERARLKAEKAAAKAEERARLKAEKAALAHAKAVERARAKAEKAAAREALKAARPPRPPRLTPAELRERKRARKRAEKRRYYAKYPEKRKEKNARREARRKERIASDPVYAERYRLSRVAAEKRRPARTRHAVVDPVVKERRRVTARLRYRKNADKERLRSRLKKARYNARLGDATPVWLDHKLLIPVLAECLRLNAETKDAYQVDHIAPLRGVTCSGLNVPWNMRVITAQENQSKGNKLNHDLLITLEERQQVVYTY